MKLEIDEIAAPRLFIFLWFWGGTGPWKSGKMMFSKVDF